VTEQTAIYRPEFKAALRAFARASQAMLLHGFEAPILVGGAAAELYSGSAITTGDFDVVTGGREAFEAALADQGFIRPPGPGHTPEGWIHPDLKLGFEIVSSTLLDGAADRSRIRLFSTGETGRIAVISVEDMIADRLGQYASGTASEMLQQAKTLFGLYPDSDLDYLERRIREETMGEYGVEDCKG
jgi:hypothetical protein